MKVSINAHCSFIIITCRTIHELKWVSDLLYVVVKQICNYLLVKNLSPFSLTAFASFFKQSHRPSTYDSVSALFLIVDLVGVHCIVCGFLQLIEALVNKQCKSSNFVLFSQSAFVCFSGVVFPWVPSQGSNWSSLHWGQFGENYYFSNLKSFDL